MSEPLSELEPLRAICAGWSGKITRAIKAKEKFQETADELMGFFCGPVGFMFKDDYKYKLHSSKYGAPTPRFQLTVAKAFELVALFGPVLYHDNPIRVVTPRRPFDIPPELFGPVAGDPMLDPAVAQAQMLHQQYQMEQGNRAAVDSLRADLLSRYLNYTPNELPYGGLARHAQRAITEALVKGRGTLWVEQYGSYSGGRKLIGSYYDSVDNLFIDPDAESLDDAMWIARRCVKPTWDVEREYGLPKDSLKGKGNYESGNTQGELEGDELEKWHRATGETNDLLVYWKIWSKMGVGTRMTGIDQRSKDLLEQTFGDFVYLVVAKDVPFPLNLPTDLLKNPDTTVVQEAAKWPVPFWTDDRWPVQCIDFYEKPRCPWPISPLAPGLGELKAINVFMSHLCNRIWSSSRDFWGVKQGATANVKSALESGSDQVIIEILESTGKLSESVEIFQQPPTNADAWKIMEWLMELFDKRTGLTELAYAMSGGMRSAKEAGLKEAQLNIRPDHMKRTVRQTMTECARCEGLALRWLETPESIAELLGPQAGQLWGQYVYSTDVAATVREMEFRVEADTVGKPNRETALANMEAAMQYFTPVAQMMMQGGQVELMNWLMQGWAKATEMQVPPPVLQPPMMPPPMPQAA